jgi:hypothetical protein
VKVVLFGSGSETALGREIGAALTCRPDLVESHFFDMIGSTTVNQLAALIERCNLLITPDTGTMHVATAVGTRVVALFFGPAYFPETGPYGEGHLVIQTQEACAPCEHSVQCKNPRCRESIRVSHVLQVIEMVREGRVEREGQLEQAPHWHGIQLYRGVFDEDQMFEFSPMIRRPLERMDLLRQVYREMWKIVLEGLPGTIDSGRVVRRILVRFSLNGLPLGLENEQSGFDRMVTLARQGIETSRKLVEWSLDIERNLEAIKRAGPAIHELDQEIELIGRTNRACHPIAYTFRQGKENLEEGDLGSLSRKTLHLYETLLREASLLTDGVEQTVSLLKVHC